MKTMLNAQGQQMHTDSRSRTWLWPLVPLYPYGRRRTIRQEVLKDTLWTFDQLQGIVYTVVPIRMSVVKLDAGGLLVYAPVAPTQECLQLVQELVAEHGDVKYIILPTVSGLEHKVFVGPFARRFPQAQVFVAPGQWSFPLNLPLSWLGFPGKRTHVLPENSTEAPFASEFDYAVLTIDLNGRTFGEVALLHRRSRTLLVTDSVLSVPEDPPAIVQLDSAPLLFHAKDNAFDRVEDNPASRRKGWQRICLFAFYLQPSAIAPVELWQSIRDAFKAPDRSKKAYFGWFPLQWKPEWKQSFDDLRGDGRLFVAPILQTLVFNRAPQKTIGWADEVASWDFQHIIPCHLDAPVKAGPRQFRQAFAFLNQNLVSESSLRSGNRPLPAEDLELLKQIEKILVRLRVAPPAKEV